MGRTLLVAVDSSPASQRAAAWCVNNLARSGDTVDLVAIAPPIAYAMTPAAPIASAGAYIQVAALSVSWEQQRKAEEEQCRHMLQQLVDHLPESKRGSLDLQRHVLPAAGGASGVAESVVVFAKERQADLVVVGSRGLGSLKSTLMSLVGLGSVSAYLVHNLHCPVAVCRGREADAAPKESRKVMVSLDDSEPSKTALEWAVANALGPQDELHLVCVALPIPYPVSAYTDDHLPQPDVQGWRRRQRAALRQAEALIRRSLRGALAAVAAEPAAAPIAQQPAVSPGEDFTFPPLPRDEWEDVYTESMHSCRASVAAAVEHAAGALQVVVEDAAASEVLEADEFDAATQDSIHYARAVVTKAVESAAAAGKVDRSKIFFKALPPEGGASDVSRSVVHYAQENQVDLVVLGARGMGSFKRAMMSFVGLGSVSDYVVHNVEAPVVVVKHA